MKIESQLLIACKEKIGFFDEVGDNLQEGHSISFYQFLDFSLSSQLAQTFVMYIFLDSASTNDHGDNGLSGDGGLCDKSILEDKE